MITFLHTRIPTIIHLICCGCFQLGESVFAARECSSAALAVVSSAEIASLLRSRRRLLGRRGEKKTKSKYFVRKYFSPTESEIKLEREKVTLIDNMLSYLLEKFLSFKYKWVSFWRNSARFIRRQRQRRERAAADG